jgi:hypothetical protein
LHIETLTREIECTFRDYAIEQIPARIEWLESYVAGKIKNLSQYKARLESGKKMQRHQLIAIKQYPFSIAETQLVIRAIKEAYAHRTA